MTLSELEQFDFFSDIETGRLTEIAGKCESSELGKGSVIFRANEPANIFYGVLDGEVELTLLFQDKVLKTDIKYEESIVVKKEIVEKPIILDTAAQGEVFGWSSLVPPRTYTSTAHCKTPCRVFRLDAGTLLKMMEDDLALGYRIRGKLNEIVGRRMRKTADNLIEAWGQAFGTGEIES